MVVVGVAQLKAKLSEYLARVRAGEDVLITEHGRPVARIVPAESDDERLAELERQGVLRRGKGAIPDDFFDLPRPADPEGSVRAALIEERREGR
jgi:prevent-host-death family protein